MKPLMLPVTHRLTGREDHVVNVLNAAHARGHLLDYHSPRRLDNDRVSISITLLQPVDPSGLVSTRPDSGRMRRGLPLAVKGLAGLAGAAALAAIGWGVWLLLQWIHTHLWVLIVGVVVTVVLAAAVSAANPNTGGQGRGCSHR